MSDTPVVQYLLENTTEIIVKEDTGKCLRVNEELERHPHPGKYQADNHGRECKHEETCVCDIVAVFINSAGKSKL